MELVEALGASATTTPGQRSQFDVLLDGDLVFSKATAGRFPEDGEIVGLVRADS